MTEPMTHQASSRSVGPTPGWAAGVLDLAVIMMIIVGVLQALTGLDAMFQGELYVTAPNYLYELDVTAWGWIHLAVGVIVAAAGFALLSGATWARVVAITMAVLSAVTNFLFIPHYPLWSLLIIALDVLAVWALAVYGGRAVA